MNKLLSIFLLILVSTPSSHARLFDRIDSVIYQSFNDRIVARLIDANYDNLYIQINVKNGLDENSFSETLKRFHSQGFRSSIYKTAQYTNITVIVDSSLAMENITEILQLTTDNIVAESLELTLLGKINQQRLLGVLNKHFNKVNLIYENAAEDIPENWLVLNNESIDKQGIDWKIALLGNLLHCYKEGIAPAFIYSEQDTLCKKDLADNGVVTDKTVASIKETLLNAIELSLNTPAGGLDYIARFKSEKQLDLATEFIKELPNLSNDSILEYYYQISKNGQLEKEEQVASTEVSHYTFPDNYFVTTHVYKEASELVKIEIQIEDIQLCNYVDCTSLLNEQWLTLKRLDKTHNIEIMSTKRHLTSLLIKLKRDVLEPLVASKLMAQENIQLTIYGQTIESLFDDTFKLLAEMPKNKDIGVKANKTPIITFNTNQSYDIQYYWQLGILPGDPHWAESELLYFALLNIFHNKQFEIDVQKINSLVNTGIKSELITSTVSADFRISTNIINEQDTLSSNDHILSPILLYIHTINPLQFEQEKQALANNLQLLNDEFKENILNDTFKLKNYKNQLIDAIQELEFATYKSFLETVVSIAPLTFSVKELEKGKNDILLQKTKNKDNYHLQQINP